MSRDDCGGCQLQHMSRRCATLQCESAYCSRHADTYWQTRRRVCPVVEQQSEGVGLSTETHADTRFAILLHDNGLAVCIHWVRQIQCFRSRSAASPIPRSLQRGMRCARLQRGCRTRPFASHHVSIGARYGSCCVDQLRVATSWKEWKTFAVRIKMMGALWWISSANERTELGGA